jgi:hypothetical protein
MYPFSLGELMMKMYEERASDLHVAEAGSWSRSSIRCSRQKTRINLSRRS